MLSGARRARAFYRNWKQEAKGLWESFFVFVFFFFDFEKVWKSGFCIDYEQSLFFPGPSRKTRETRKWPRARRERHEKRLNLKKKRDSSQSSCYRLRENWPLIGWNYAGVTPCMRVTSLQNRLALAGKTLNMVQGYRSNEGQTKIVVLFVAEHHR